MKKLLAIILSVFMLAIGASCVDVPGEGVTLMAPDGAPGIVVSKIANDGKVGSRPVETNIVAGADQIVANVTNGSADMAVMPLNLAAKLYNGGVDIKLVSVNIFGSLYMVGMTPVDGVEALKGKVVYNIGRGGTPDMTFKYILKNKGVEFVESETPVEGKVALQYVTDGSELIGLFKSNSIEYGILGEPAVTNCNKAAGTQVVLSIQDEWKAITGENYTQAGFVVSGELAADLAFMNSLGAELNDTAEWCKSNADSLKELLTSKGSKLTVGYTPELIEKCSVGYVSAGDARADVEKYLTALMGFNSNVVGGKLPDSNFYYGYKG